MTRAAAAYTVRCVTWHDQHSALAAVRRAVFIVEQGVPEALEWDEDDPVAVHALAVSTTGEAIGTGRLLHDGRIGRMAALPQWRGRGVGAALLELLIEKARELRYPTPHLHAQTHALHFYERYGFRVIGDEFMEAGIPHRAMCLDCGPVPDST